MKIDGGAQGAYAAYRNTVDPLRRGQGEAESAQGAAITRSDRADISSQGRLRAQATDAVHAAPATRADLVAQLRTQIKSGTYTVDEQNLAARLAQHIDIKA